MVSVAKKRTNTESSNSSSIDSDGRIKSNNGSVSPPNSTTTTTNSPSVDFYQLAVKDLNLNQLRLLHLDHVKHKEVENL